MASDQIQLIPNSRINPQYCQYALGLCDQDFSAALKSDGLFLYPSQPEQVASTIEAAIGELSKVAGEKRWKSWKNLNVAGQIIFCEICKAIRFSHLVVADITTLNFNLLFEIGYALGLQVPVLPIRDTSNIRDIKDFKEIGILDTFGYFDYRNSSQLADGVLSRVGTPPLTFQSPQVNLEQPLFVVKSPVESNGMIKMMSVIKKSRLRFRSYDPKEIARISVHEAYKQAASSRAVVLHLLGPDTIGADVHNAKCAFIAGIAMAAQRRVAVIQPGYVVHPIDYRDVILSYERPSQIPDLLTPLLGQTIEEIQTTRFVPTTLPLRPLEKVDLGDLAAENEILALDSYFVPTAQYQQARRGHARLVVGRKGSGKTALFYGLRSTYRPIKSHLVLDLKPEGHQFKKLREAVLAGLPEGTQQHVLTAFWNYLLTMELAHEIVHHEQNWIYKDSRLFTPFQKIQDGYGEPEDIEQGDFSERLLTLVEAIIEKRGALSSLSTTAEITQLIHQKPIREMNDAIATYLNAGKRDVWLLFDNLDKGWPVHSIRNEDILLLRALLEATRKLQRQFESRGVELFSVVFIRNDIYQHLIVEPADRGKETAAILDWNDPQLFKDVVERRIAQSTGLNLEFEHLWAAFFVPHVHGEDSFQYLVNRTLMRPREVLRLVRECINNAINRKGDRVNEEDILKAEQTCSAEALVDISHEMRDVKPQYDNVPYAFISCTSVLSRTEVEAKLTEAGIAATDLPEVVELLLWFGVLGVYVSEDEERYSYEFEHDPKLMTAGLKKYAYCIHPAFRPALGCGRS